MLRREKDRKESTKMYPLIRIEGTRQKRAEAGGLKNRKTSEEKEVDELAGTHGYMERNWREITEKWRAGRNR